MLAVVLCPGPSLATLAALPACDITLAVNRAAMKFPADWWVALDKPSYETPPSVVPKTWLTTHAVRPEITAPEGVTIHEVEDWFEQFPPDMGGACWTSFSMTAALIAARYAGATRIEVYGYDAVDAPDFDGFKHPISNRSAGRWDHEAQCWSVVTSWLAKQRCHVTRIKR